MTPTSTSLGLTPWLRSCGDAGLTFLVALYAGHLFFYGKDTLNPDLHITRDTPPTFLLHAENDNVDGVTNSLSYYTALKDAGAAVELHLYAAGRHAFGCCERSFRLRHGLGCSKRG